MSETVGDLLPSDEELYRRAGSTVRRGDDGSLMIVCPDPEAVGREARRYTDVLAPMIIAEAKRRVEAMIAIRTAVKRMNAQATGPIERWVEPT